MVDEETNDDDDDEEQLEQFDGDDGCRMIITKTTHCRR